MCGDRRLIELLVMPTVAVFGIIATSVQMFNGWICRRHWVSSLLSVAGDKVSLECESNVGITQSTGWQFEHAGGCPYIQCKYDVRLYSCCGPHKQA
jgi:hypothetical protein